MTQPTVVLPLMVLTSALSRSFFLKGQDKAPTAMVWGQVASDYTAHSQHPASSEGLSNTPHPADEMHLVG